MKRASAMGRIVLLPVVLLVALGLVACGGADETTPPVDNDAGAADSTVSVNLQEWAVIPDTTSAKAGEVTFEVNNVGEETHEFVVISTDIGSLDLPTSKDGSVDEAGGPLDVVDEIEDITPGSSETLTVDLEAGHYVLICNIVEEEDNGETESHYHQGMRIDFEVTE